MTNTVVSVLFLEVQASVPTFNQEKVIKQDVV